MVSINSLLKKPIKLWQSCQKLLFDKNRVKTPTLLQMEAVECGAAALGIILRYYGRTVPLTELRQECGVSRDGSKASNILKAARRYDLEAKGFKKELEKVKELKPPFIVFWNFNHFLVVEGFSQDQIYLNDPAIGPRKLSLEEFDQGYTGVTLVMHPGEDFTKGGHEPSVIRALWSRLRGSFSALVYCVLAGFFLTLAGLVIPAFNKIFVDEILIEGRYQWLRPMLLAMAITAIFQGILKLLQFRYLRRLKIKLAVGMSGRFFWHILRLPTSFYAQRFAGEICKRLSLNDTVAESLSGELATNMIGAVMTTFYVLVMFQYDKILTLLVVVFAAINIITLQLISRQRVDANQKLIQEYGKASGVAIAGLQSIENLKASGLESDFFSRWSGYYAKATNSQQELGVSNQVLSNLPVLLSSLSSAFLLIVGGFRVMDGYLSIGMLVAFQTMVQNFQKPINDLVNFAGKLQELEGNIIRLDDVLDNPTDAQLQKQNRASLSPGESVDDISARLQGYIDIQELTFGYSRLDPPLIEDFSLSIKPGERIALVGGSGSGKSTLAQVIAGLSQPWSGEILFDGQPRTEIAHQVLSNSIAFVEQDILLFEGTVRDNLTLWDTTISDRSLKRACQDAAIDDVIDSLAGGLNAPLAEGATNLSGGQRQRLEIARALANNPSILIMDEATSALDVETEKIIDRHLRQRGCTCLIVAHRLSTIRDCDLIVVLENGKVVQRGTHEELCQIDGVYSRLIKSEGQ